MASQQESLHTAMSQGMFEVSSCSPTTSLERRTCRICQSETGEMIHPCNCHGSIGQIHSNCLNKWVATSQKRRCEICHEEYHRSGERYKALKEWNKPSCGRKEFLLFLIIVGLIWSLFYLTTLIIERKMIIRWLRSEELPMRSDDMGRFFFTLIAFILFVTTTFNVCSAGIHYFKAQKEIRFIDKQTD